MKTPTLIALTAALLLLAGPTARAELCGKCKDMMYTADIGQCVECKTGYTSSGAFKLCKACSAKLGQCEHCRVALGNNKQSLIAPPGSAATETKIATAWVTALLEGNVDEVMNLSEAPFSWDRKQTVQTTEELRQLCQKVADKNGKREIKLDGADVLKGEAALAALKEHSLLNQADLVPVAVQVKNETIVVLVKPGAQPKVVGFSD